MISAPSDPDATTRLVAVFSDLSETMAGRRLVTNAHIDALVEEATLLFPRLTRWERLGFIEHCVLNLIASYARMGRDLAQIRSDPSATLAKRDTPTQPDATQTAPEPVG